VQGRKTQCPGPSPQIIPTERPLKILILDWNLTFLISLDPFNTYWDKEGRVHCPLV
jgi:hypothetical protein